MSTPDFQLDKFKLSCEWPSLEKGTPCTHCGYKLPKSYPEPPFRNCKERKVTPREELMALGLGDCAERLLSSVGITKEKVNEVVTRYGLPPCDCDGRQEWLNKVGKYFGIGVAK